MVELKLVWWPQFPTEEFEYHYLPLTATVGTPRFEYEEAPYFQRLLLHANAAQAHKLLTEFAPTDDRYPSVLSSKVLVELP